MMQNMKLNVKENTELNIKYWLIYIQYGRLQIKVKNPLHHQITHTLLI